MASRDDGTTRTAAAPRSCGPTIMFSQPSRTRTSSQRLWSSWSSVFGRGSNVRQFSRILFAGVVSAFLATPVGEAAAQGWPQRPVTFIVSQSAGASPDVMARMLADRLSRVLGQAVVIDNKPGGGN